MDSNICIGAMSGSGLRAGHHNIFIGRRTGSTLEVGSKNVLIGDKLQCPSTTCDDTFVISEKMPTIASIYYLSIINIIPRLIVQLEEDFSKVIAADKIEEVKVWMNLYRDYLLVETGMSVEKINEEFNRIIGDYLTEVNKGESGENFNFIPPPPLFSIHLYQVLQSADFNAMNNPRYKILLEKMKEEVDSLLQLDSSVEIAN